MFVFDVKYRCIKLYNIVCGSLVGKVLASHVGCRVFEPGGLTKTWKEVDFHKQEKK